MRRDIAEVRHSQGVCAGREVGDGVEPGSVGRLAPPLVLYEDVGLNERLARLGITHVPLHRSLLGCSFVRHQRDEEQERQSVHRGYSTRISRASPAHPGPEAATKT